MIPSAHKATVSDAASFFLIGITLLSSLAALAFGVAGINILMDAPRIGAQCPLAQGDVGDSAVCNETDNVVQLENRTVGCGGVWERELAGALEGKQR